MINTKYYRVYGKEKTGKRFKALDLANGVFVDNLIYASVFDDSMLDKARQAITDLTENNPGYTFELRKV